MERLELAQDGRTVLKPKDEDVSLSQFQRGASLGADAFDDEDGNSQSGLPCNNDSEQFNLHDGDQLSSSVSDRSRLQVVQTLTNRQQAQEPSLDKMHSQPAGSQDSRASMSLFPAQPAPGMARANTAF